MNGNPVQLVEVANMATDMWALVRRLDPDTIPDSDVAAVMSQLGRAGRLIEGAATMMARRVADTGCHRQSGHRSAAAFLAATAGTSTARAAQQIITSDRLVEQPETLQAVRDGALSNEQAAAVADAVAADPQAASEVLGAAAGQDLASLRKVCRKVRHRADPDPEATRRRHHRQRSFRSWTDADGEWRAAITAPGDVGARVEAAIRGAHDQVFKAAHAAGVREDDAAYRLDALLDMVETGAACGSGHRPASSPSAEAPEAAGAPDAVDSSDGMDASGADEAAGAAEGPDSVAADGAAAGQTPDAGGAAVDPAADPDGPRGPVAAPTPAPTDAATPIPFRDQPEADQHVNARPRPPDQPASDRAGPPDRPHPAGRTVAGLGCLPVRRSGRQTQVIIHVAGAALKRGHLASGEICRIEGIGDVALSAVREQIPDAHIAYVIRHGRDVNVTHLGRQASARQRTALLARGHVCEVPGCDGDHLLEIDHVADWAFTHRTVLEELAWLCRHHHRQKSAGTHRLNGPPGQRRWTATSNRIPAGVAWRD